MRFPGFIGASYQLQSLNADCQRCVNLYPEMDEMGTGNEGEVASLVSTPGLRLLVTLPTGPVRGTYTDSTGQLWAVGGNTLYKISSLWVATAWGTLNTSTGAVSFSDNGTQAVCVDGAYGYFWYVGSLAQTSTVTTGGTTTLTSSSTKWQQFTGTLTQNVAMPSTTTLSVGFQFYVENVSSNVLNVRSSDGTAIQVMAANSLIVLTCISTAGSAGTGDWATSYVTSHVTSSTFAQITDSNFLGATHVAFMDGYLIFNKPSTAQFFISPLNALLPFDGTDIGSAEAAPDTIAGLVELQESIYIFSQKHLEVFYDSGDTFPFVRIQGAVIEIGCAAPFSIAKVGNAVHWLGQDNNGRGIVYAVQGLQAQRISTFAIEQEIVALGDLSNARAWTYQQAGHLFYCLNLPGDTRTWCYDTTTQLWHERTYLSAGTYARSLPDCHSYAYSTNVVGDYSSGNVYSLDRTIYSDNGNPIVRERSSPHVSKDLLRIFHSQFQLDMQTGVGIDGSGQGSSPQAMLQWSNDNGNSWSNEHWASIGAIGSRLTRVSWRRLGVSRDRVYRVRISDPVSVTLIGAQIDIEAGTS